MLIVKNVEKINISFCSKPREGWKQVTKVTRTA
jgi:hypothetical protein